MNRRHLLTLVGATAALCACGDLGWASPPGLNPPAPGPEGLKRTPRSGLTRKDAVRLGDSDWRKVLTPKEYNILRSAGTERAFTGDLWDHKKDGIYVCAGCGLPLFDSRTKFRSGTGWPSYYQPIAKDRVEDRIDRKFGMIRTENVCARCGGHLGHVFPDGPRPTGLRYCINSYAMDFLPREQASKLKGSPVLLGGLDGEAGKKLLASTIRGGAK